MAGYDLEFLLQYELPGRGQEINIKHLAGGALKGCSVGYECLEPDGLSLEICGVVKFQIYLLLGEYGVELMDVARKTHEFTGIIIGCLGAVLGKQP